MKVLPCETDNTPIGSSSSDFAFEILVDHLGIAIGAFDPALVARDLHPDTGMAKRAFAAITRHTVAINDLGFWSFGDHASRSFLGGSNRG